MHTVVIQDIQIIREKVHVFDKKGNQIFLKTGEPKMTTKKREIIIDERHEEFLSIYNAESRAERINMDITDYGDRITRAMVIKHKPKKERN